MSHSRFVHVAARRPEQRGLPSLKQHGMTSDVQININGWEGKHGRRAARFDCRSAVAGARLQDQPGLAAVHLTATKLAST